MMPYIPGGLSFPRTRHCLCCCTPFLAQQSSDLHCSAVSPLQWKERLQQLTHNQRVFGQTEAVVDAFGVVIRPQRASPQVCRASKSTIRRYLPVSAVAADKGKPAVRQGRKAIGSPGSTVERAGLPKGIREGDQKQHNALPFRSSSVAQDTP